MEAKSYPMHESLLEGCRKGDRKAQAEIFRLYAKAMYNTALRITGSTAEAQDVLQEAFLDAFLHLTRYTGEATFGAWLKRIVLNKAINAVKRNRLVIWEDQALERELAQATEPEGDPDARPWRVEQVMRALEKLPPGYRVVFSLYLLEGYDHQEIAEILGISESGSKSQLNRAKNRIKELIQEQHNER